ncbi:MAG TPA: hypothetical protein VJ997_15255 [Longimicrobiales bacterium]|nr:hypothetical protein [Longimicrobiales bacterium]
MYQPMLFLHWKQIKVVLIPFVVAAFALPLLSVQGLGASGNAGEDVMAYVLLGLNQSWLPLFPALAAAIGITLALSAWNWDHQLNHVYALSLPLPRWEFALLKMGAGAVLTTLPGVAFWLGAHLAASSVTLPAGLHAYPDALALRFFLAILLAYSLFFALAAGTVKTTMVLASGLLAFLVVGGAVNGYLGNSFEFFRHTNIVDSFFKVLASSHGPLEVFSGSWTLFDV